MPNSLQWLLSRLIKLVQTATSALEASYPQGVEAWQAEISRQLARYSAAAIMAGAGVDTLSKPMTVAITQDLATQLKFLAKFGVEIQSGQQWQAGWNSRAELYAKSIATPYWRGTTKMLPLPAMPCDGTSQCLTNCKCSWSIVQLDGDNNYDCTWVMGATEDHCQTCPERARSWAPLQIREGVLQI